MNQDDSRFAKANLARENAVQKIYQRQGPMGELI